MRELVQQDLLIRSKAPQNLCLALCDICSAWRSFDLDSALLRVSLLMYHVKAPGKANEG